MSNRYSLARLLPILAFAVLGLCFAQGAAAQFPKKKAADPGSPPSSSPNSSGNLNNFGSDWAFAFSSISPAEVFLEWAPPIPPATNGTAIIRGVAVGGEVSPGGTFVPGRQAVWDVDIRVSGVVRTIDPPTTELLVCPCTQTVTYTGILTGANPATVTGTYKLNGPKTIDKFGSLPTPQGGENPDQTTWVINVGASAILPTLNLSVDPPHTFPVADLLGVHLDANQVFSFSEKRTYTESPAQLPAASGGDSGESIFKAVNRVLGLTGGNSFTSNAELEPLLVEPDFIWEFKAGHRLALISVSAGNTNTLGVYTDVGTGNVRFIVDTSTGFTAHPQPFPAKILPPLVPDSQFGWYLDSEGGSPSSSNTFFSEPSLNKPLGAGVRHLRTYNLTTVEPVLVKVKLPDDSIISVRPTLLLAWEDLVVGDNDYNDAMYIVADMGPVGTTSTGSPVARYCHSRSLFEADPADCKADDLDTTGSVESVASSCPSGTPVGLVQVVNRPLLNGITFKWSALNCGSDTGTQAFTGVNGQTLIAGQRVKLEVINGDLRVIPGSLGYGVKGPGDKVVKLENVTIEGNEAIRFSLVNSADRFTAVNAQFWMPKKNGTATVMVTAECDGGDVTQLRHVTAKPNKFFTGIESFAFGGSCVAVKFGAANGSAYGLGGDGIVSDGPSFLTAKP